MRVTAGKETPRCVVCDRPLRSAESISRGYGARCAPSAGVSKRSGPHGIGGAPTDAVPSATPHRIGQASAKAIEQPAIQAFSSQSPMMGATSRVPAAEDAAPVVTEFAPVRYVGQQFPVTSLGYDADSRRLEMQLADGQILAYRNVGQDVYDGLLQLGQVPKPEAIEASARWQYHYMWTPDRVHGRATYQYRTRTEADTAGQRVRCSVCGQFAGPEHFCPGSSHRVDQEPKPRPVDEGQAETVEVQPPDGGTPMLARTFPIEQIADVVHAAPEGALVPVRALVPADEQMAADEAPPLSDVTRAMVAGNLVLALDDEGRVGVGRSQLRCSCGAHSDHGDCRHVREFAGGFRAAVEEQLVADDQDLVARLARPYRESPVPGAPEDLSSFSYQQDPDRFAADVLATLDSPGTERVPFMVGDEQHSACYGYGSSRRFGVELEWTVGSFVPEWGGLSSDEELPGATWDETEEEAYDEYDEVVIKPDGSEQSVSRFGWHTEFRPVLTYDGDNDPDLGDVARSRVVAWMNRDGLTSDSEIGQHGETGSYGYSEEPWGGWTLEADPTVDGAEVISPVLSDTPDGWRSLQATCRHISEAGGDGGAAAGSHVTVSATDYVDAPNRVNRLIDTLRYCRAELDAMADSGSGRQMSNQYATPFAASPPVGWLNVEEIQQAGRYHTVNLDHIPSTRDAVDADSSRIEFRLWDASLDPGTVQAQIKVSAALLDFVAAGGGAPAGWRKAEESGDGDRHVPHPSSNREEFTERTERARWLIDSLFHRDVDKVQAAALWASGISNQSAW